MKKISIILSSLAMFVSVGDAYAANKSAVFGGYSFGEDASYGYLGGVTSLNQNIDKDSFLLRVGGGFGKYNYSTPAVENQNVHGQVSSVDLMVGYQKFFKMGHIAAYAGANYDNHDLNKEDPSNRVVGGRSGAKGQIEITLTPIKNLVVRNISNYTSAFHAYWTQTMVGWNFGKVTVGPEVAFLGSNSFNQQRFGVNFSDIKVSVVNLYFAGGYMKSSGRAGDDGGYTSIGFATKF